MRPRLLHVAVSILWVVSSAALANEGVATIDELRVPASPAFVLMGVSPSSVERPSTPRAFAFSLISATEASDTSYPTDWAVEFAPYWWKARPYETFEDYYYGRKQDGSGARKKGIGTSVLQTFAVSLATVDFEDLTGVKGTRGGFGVRFMLLEGKPAPQLLALEEKLQLIQLEAADRCVPDDPTEPMDEACLEGYEAKLKKAAGEIAMAPRTGWMVEFAGALTADYPDDDAGAVEAGRRGAWVTASYRAPTADGEAASSLSVVFVGRYLRDDIGDETLGTTDVGARAIWTADPSTMPPLGFSFEYVRRFVSGSAPDTDKVAAVLEYRTPLDNISLVASYGKDFKDALTGKEPLISTLGISFGFGRGPVVRLPDLADAGAP